MYETSDPLELVAATWQRRLVAIALDTVLLAALWFCMGLFLFIVAFAQDVPSVFWLPLMILPLVYFGTEVLRDSSIAKYLLKMRITRSDCTKLSVSRRLARWALKTFPFLISVTSVIPVERWQELSLTASAVLGAASLVVNVIVLILKGKTLFDLAVGSTVAISITTSSSQAFPVH